MASHLESDPFSLFRALSSTGPDVSFDEHRTKIPVALTGRMQHVAGTDVNDTAEKNHFSCEETRLVLGFDGHIASRHVVVVVSFGCPFAFETRTPSVVLIRAPFYFKSIQRQCAECGATYRLRLDKNFLLNTCP